MEEHSGHVTAHKGAAKASAELLAYIDLLISEGGSDLHFSAGAYPTLRVSGALVPLTQYQKLTPENTFALLESLVTAQRKDEFLRDLELDFSYHNAERDVRFRGNASFQQGAISIALRLIPRVIQTFSELNLPPVLETFAQRKQGFFLVVGPVGQGKSTTLASFIEHINQTRAEHIITIEDPIEYIFEGKQSLINQREVKLDTKDFHIALGSSFRQDVNVIMVGEMRSAETISTAVTAAETGHLVISTLHTNNAAQTIDRIIDSFPAYQQPQIRVQLAGSLAGIFSQRLVPRIAGGLVPAFELLINTKAVANMIREGRTHEINTMIETGSDMGMISLNTSLGELVKNGQITVEQAFQSAADPKELERRL